MGILKKKKVNDLCLTELPNNKVHVLSWIQYNLIYYLGFIGPFFASFDNSIFSI